MSFYKTMSNRASTRNYVPGKKIDREVMNRWIEFASHQPTSSNVQQFSILVVEDQEMKEKLKSLTWGQQHVADSGAFVFFLADQRKYIKAAKINNADPIYLETADSYITGMQDAMIAATAFSTAVHMDGYGSCFVGAIKGNITEIRKLFNMPEYVMPVVGMSVGHIGRRSGVKPKNIEGIAHFGKYDLEKVEKSVEDYDKVMVKYFTERGARDRSTWSARIVKATGGMTAPLKATQKELIEAWKTFKI